MRVQAPGYRFVRAAIRTEAAEAIDFRRDAADAAKNGFDGPTIFGIGKENFAGALCFRPVVPALEQREMTLANGGGGRGRGPGPGFGPGSILRERGESGFEARFENAASELGCAGAAQGLKPLHFG